MQEHLEIRLIGDPALGGQRARPRQFLRGNANGDGFRGAGQVGLAQATHLSLLSCGLESLGEDFGVRIPPGGFLFLAGKFGNGLVAHRTNRTTSSPFSEPKQPFRKSLPGRLRSQSGQ